ncbi:MAG: bifunctional 4-hydroxy-2-oxoglutarate aldolase/2-dehydro-3-deoxy-phosphogluconate aldolase [Verrucomicrobiota bacterium]|nr:bifunctional 4-hydroxy-2-oxoglutarate aldolase/2-dehydro-3-deoxy-phosphogluconate aldolase [Verrucomicrobiota bacterium]
MTVKPFHLTERILPIVVLEKASDAIPLAKAVLDAGLNMIEITLRSAAAFEGIANICRQFPDMVVGAGTVIDVDSVSRIIDLGVSFAVSPGLNEAVVAACQARQLAHIPGVVTPSEFERGRALGLEYLKFFPAEAAGGAKYLNALAGPFAHTGLKVVPTGGIDATKLCDYLKIPMVAAVGGSWFVDRKLIAAGNWAEITRLTRYALELSRK